MGLSSNSIIHFTRSLSSLKGILTETFKIRYCREIIDSKTNSRDILIPMVSFCDIPFSQILKHVDSYGSYGIGLKKTWAESKGLNPVLYIDKNSALANNFFKHLFSKLTEKTTSQTELSAQEKYILDIVRYMKNYQGDLKRIGKKTIKNYRFSDEREWRYVLDPQGENTLLGNLEKRKNDDAKVAYAKKILNETVQSERLSFIPDDINYIIIRKETERDMLIRTLEHVTSKYPHEQVKRLTSRVISVDQIKTDF